MSPKPSPTRSPVPFPARIAALGLCALAAAALMPASARAQTQPDLCAIDGEEQTLDKYQLLRRLSLDLRGHVPSYEEYEALAEHDTVPEAWVKEWMTSEGFRLVARRYHESLLWPNVSNVRWVGTNARLTALTFGAQAISSTGKRRTYRGVTDLVTTAHGAQCGDFEQTNFDPAFPGQFRPHPDHIVYENKGTTTETRQEGWRMVEPYWAPGTQVKVCAYDAQLTPTVVIGSGANARTVSCGSSDADGRRECGCGPNLQWCHPQSATPVETPIRDALREQMGRQVDEVTVGGRPYTDLILSTTAWQNGKIAFWKRHLAGHYNLSLTFNVAHPDETIADLPFTDDTWVKVDRGPMHAGVLTLPAYLLRFQTDRGRANRQRIAFECEHFAPPAVLPTQQGCSTTTDDLMNRCSCQYCHEVLEPLAARFGKFAEAGTTLMTDATRFPPQNTACASNNPSAFCRRFYVTESGAPRRGWLQPLQFADVYPHIQAAYDEGPRGRAQQLIETGAFARCTVKRVFAHFVKRELRVSGESADELELMQSLASGFTQNEYSYPWLVERVVSLPQYRRVR